MADDRFWKIEELPYVRLSSSSTDRHKTWYDNASWPFQP